MADSGYFSGSQIGLAEERHYEVLVNAPSSETTISRSAEKNPYHTSWFTYDENRDCCICPHGQVLRYLKTRSRGHNQNPVTYLSLPHVFDLSVSLEVQQEQERREIEISVHHRAIERQRAKRKDPDKKLLLSRRKTIIEPVFAWIKRHLGFDRWTVYGLERVKAQWAFVCTVLNMTKLYKRWRSGGLRLATS